MPGDYRAAEPALLHDLEILTWRCLWYQPFHGLMVDGSGGSGSIVASPYAQ